MIRSCVFLFVLVIGMGSVHAQDQVESLFTSNTKFGFYIASGLQVGPVTDQTAVFGNVRAGVTLNNNFSAGGSVSWTMNEFTPGDEIDQSLYLDMRMAGLNLEYTMKPSKLVHLTFPVTVGLGEIEVDPKGDSDFDGDYAEDNFVFIEPAALIEVNLLQFLRLYGGATYRVVASEVDYRGISQSEISGFTGTFGLRFTLNLN